MIISNQKLTQSLNDLLNNNPDFDFTISYNEKVYITNLDFRRCGSTMFGESNCRISDLEAAWLYFLSNYEESIKRIYKAIVETTYEPLENYNKIMTIDTEKLGSESNTNTRTGSIVNNEELGKGITTTKSDNSPFDSSEYFPNTLDTIEEGSRSNTRTQNYNNLQENNILSYNNRKDITTENTHGNIGTTKNQDMAMDEINLRLKWNFITIILKMFFSQFCYY